MIKTFDLLQVASDNFLTLHAHFFFTAKRDNAAQVRAALSVPTAGAEAARRWPSPPVPAKLRGQDQQPAWGPAPWDSHPSQVRRWCCVCWSSIPPLARPLDWASRAHVLVRPTPLCPVDAYQDHSSITGPPQHLSVVKLGWRLGWTGILASPRRRTAVAEETHHHNNVAHRSRPRRGSSLLRAHLLP